MEVSSLSYISRFIIHRWEIPLLFRKIIVVIQTEIKMKHEQLFKNSQLNDIPAPSPQKLKK